jgi:diketogulonate reductase-like aldo/keto reductase
MKLITLNNGQKMPAIGLGTWRTEKTTVKTIVEDAINRCGYSHIDCASIYGNEKEIGVAFNNIFSKNKSLRKDVFITSKLWNTYHHPDSVEKACRQTLKDLQLTYLDLYLVHWGVAFPHGKDLEPIGDNGLVETDTVPIQQTWQAMEKLVKEGLVKNIGIANFTCPMLIDLLSYASIKPVINQIEVHPYNSQKNLIEYCHKQNIQVTAYSPLGSGRNKIQKPIDDEVVIKIAKKINKTPAQVLLRWSLQNNLIVIPKTTKQKRLAENIDVFAFELSEIHMKELDGLNKNFRFVNPIEWWGIPYFG